MLIGNTALLMRLPLRHVGGGVLSGTRQQWNTNAANNNIAVGWSPMQYAGYPVGYVHPRGYNMPISSNFISSFDRILGDSDFTASGTRGVNGSSAISGLGSLVGSGQLIVSASSTIAGLGSMTGSVVALLNGTATIAGTGSATGFVNALGNALAALGGTGTCTMTSYAVGNLEADITPFTELSPENLAEAVWSREIDGDYTAGVIMKVLAAIAAGKTTIDTGGPDPIVTFRDLMDTLDRVTATMSGSERITITIDES